MPSTPPAPGLRRGLQEEGHDDRHERHKLRDERQTFKEFPYHDEDSVTRPALQFNGGLAVGRWQATLNAFYPRFPNA